MKRDKALMRRICEFLEQHRNSTILPKDVQIDGAGQEAINHHIALLEDCGLLGRCRYRSENIRLTNAGYDALASAQAVEGAEVEWI